MMSTLTSPVNRVNGSIDPPHVDEVAGLCVRERSGRCR